MEQTSLATFKEGLRRKGFEQKAVISERNDQGHLIGFSNLVELANDGRTGECFNCGRLIQSRSYWTREVHVCLSGCRSLR